MDDNDLLAAVREDFARVRMNTEAEAILADGASLRRRRHRHRAYGAGAAALCAAAAISVASLTPGSASTSGTRDAQLAAWTVQRQPDGTVAVTIRDMLNLAGLQQKLNADGVPAVVIADERNPSVCRNDKAMKEDMASVIQFGRPGRPSLDRDFFVIHPAAIPSGSKLLLDVFDNTPGGAGGKMWGIGVKSSPHAAGAKHAVSVSAGMEIVYGNC
jgi:hypothetical protein